MKKALIVATALLATACKETPGWMINVAIEKCKDHKGVGVLSDGIRITVQCNDGFFVDSEEFHKVETNHEKTTIQ